MRRATLVTALVSACLAALLALSVLTLAGRAPWSGPGAAPALLLGLLLALAACGLVCLALKRRRDGSLAALESQLAVAANDARRLRDELEIAFDIQHGLLPKLDKVNAGDARIELAGFLKPAQAVGGDLYNAFFVDRSHLCICMGDVSGKGISASLFMGVVQTLIRSAARYDASPAAIISSVNRDRAGSNDSCMFVTLFCAVLDMRTGSMAFCNGGHNPPVLLRRDGTAAFLQSRAGTLVGLDPGAAYRDEYTVLKPGDSLFLYTDGVTEAFRQDGLMYGESRLVEFLQGKSALSCQGVVESLRGDVAAFVDGAPQSDDIAMLTIRYLGDRK